MPSFQKAGWFDMLRSRRLNSLVPTGFRSVYPTSRAIRLNPVDNIAVVISALRSGDQVRGDGWSFVTSESIAAGHKVAIQEIAAVEKVLKYGQPIGLASEHILPGQWIHSHNLKDDHSENWELIEIAPPLPPSPIQRTWMGFDRGDGRFGTRNYVGILSTVNCSATVCHEVRKRFDAERMQRWPNVDGIFVATHTTGCAFQYDGLKHQMLARVLEGYAEHANTAACLIIGLGCEQNTPIYLKERGVVQIGSSSDPAISDNTQSSGIPTLTIQSVGGTRATIDRAEAALIPLLDRANESRRVQVDARELTLAMECGGSDGYSGITANPAVGVVSDRIVACGGTSIISETTELYGAEHLLIRRSASREVAQALIERLEWWKKHAAMYGATIDNNPSVGNKAGGLTTITEKSLGAVSKTGQTAMKAVYQYASPVRTKGMVIMDSPGFDPSSVTGKVAGGANLVLFTTGRGSAFGCKPVPVIKISSHSALFRAMPDDMDFDAGPIVAGRTVESVGEELFEFALKVASGEKTCSERLGLGDHEFIPWTVGPVL
jgi:altronate hydrolase